MKNAYTAVVKQDDGWWVGWIQEIPGVNCQERTKEELIESLRVTLKEALEFNREEALKAADSDYLKSRSFHETRRADAVRTISSRPLVPGH